MAYFVLHSRKVKTMAGAREVVKHNLRKKDNLEEFIDVTKSQLNFYDGATEENFFVVFERFVAHLPRKIQRNASRIIEFVVSFSHEFGYGWEANPELKNKIENFFNDAEEFLKQRFGDVIICRTDHYDEKTPHSHFLLVPLCRNKNGILRFSSSEFLGGKYGLVDLHDKFHEKVGQKYGLERGIRNSRTGHIDLKNYEEWEKSQRKNLKNKEKEVNEKLAQIRQQQVENQQLKEQMRGQSEILAKKEKEVKSLKQRLLDLSGEALKRIDDLSKQKQDYEEMVKKVNVEPIPQIPIPPASIIENSRKNWRDEVQSLINEAFGKIVAGFHFIQTKYDNLFNEYQKLMTINKAYKQRAEQAEKDILEKPIEEIVAFRKLKTPKAHIQQKSDEIGGPSR